MIEQQKIGNDFKVGGWLNTFLWVGIFLGSLIVIVDTIVAISNLETDDCILFSALTLLLWPLVGITSVILFYKKKPYAFTYGLAYLMMLLVYAFFALFMTAFVEMANSSKTSLSFGIVFSLLWSIGWLVFLFKSKNVRQLRALPGRKYSLVSMAILLIYCILTFTFCLSFEQEIYNDIDNVSDSEYEEEEVPEVASDDYEVVDTTAAF